MTGALAAGETQTIRLNYVPPTSAVYPLPETISTTSFTVSWSGSDGSGLGITGYDVYVSDDGGPVQPISTATTPTSATFSGQYGHTYGFVILATDALGLVQPGPSAAQTTTTIPSLVTVTSVRPITNKKRLVSQIDVAFSGAVNI